ncbi:hypothetical protein WMY93_033792 [Mugilogobius chulae]|uniref:Uncharacterized protein n=1 Tax=Mugilogobius chulae TaxID=88201 RepID=A0AAW0MJP2_9GOBI
MDQTLPLGPAQAWSGSITGLRARSRLDVRVSKQLRFYSCYRSSGRTKYNHCERKVWFKHESSRIKAACQALSGADMVLGVRTLRYNNEDTLNYSAAQHLQGKGRGAVWELSSLLSFSLARGQDGSSCIDLPPKPSESGESAARDENVTSSESGAASSAFQDQLQLMEGGLEHVKGSLKLVE